MDWLNLHTSTLDDPKLAAADDAQRSHWLHLIRHCIGQENNGCIHGAATWSDRKWLLLCRITEADAMAPSELWEWDDKDLYVWGYPKEKQREVQAKRKGGQKSAEQRAAKALLEAGRSVGKTAGNSAVTEGKGREGKGIGREEEGGARPQTLEQVQTYAQSIGLSDLEARKFFDHFTANGWLLSGRSAMKSWPAALRNWKRRAGDFGTSGSVPRGKISSEEGARTADPVIFGAVSDAAVAPGGAA